jgi:hypothetical protein
VAFSKKRYHVNSSEPSDLHGDPRPPKKYSLRRLDQSAQTLAIEIFRFKKKFRITKKFLAPPMFSVQQWGLDEFCAEARDAADFV